VTSHTDAVLCHAEVFSDGAVFYIAEMTDTSARRYVGILEAKNLKTLDRATDDEITTDVIDATFHDTKNWKRANLADWDEDNLYARYEGDAHLTRIYEWIGPKTKLAENTPMDDPNDTKQPSAIQTHLSNARNDVEARLVANGHTLGRTKSITIDGIFVQVTYAEDYERFIGGSATGRAHVTAGNYPHRKVFPLRKNGSVDIENLVAHIEQCFARDKAVDVDSRANRAAEVAAIETRNVLVAEYYSDPVQRERHDADYFLKIPFVEPKPDEPVQLTATKHGLGLQIKGGLTHEQAHVLLETCRTLGLLTKGR